MLLQVFFWLVFFLSISFFMLDSIMLIGAFSFLFSLIICLLVSSVYTTWFAAIVVIVYVGGLLVMFSYFLAVSPNQVISQRYGNFALCFVFSVMVVFSGLSVFFCPVSFGGSGGGVDYLFSSDSGGMFIFFVLFLLISLFCVVSVVQLCEGPLRPFRK